MDGAQRTMLTEAISSLLFVSDALLPDQPKVAATLRIIAWRLEELVQDA